MQLRRLLLQFSDRQTAYQNSRYSSSLSDQFFLHLYWDSVYGMLAIETAQTVMSGADAYYWFAKGFGSISHLTNPYLSPFDTPMLGAVISLIVQVFFCYRIWKLESRLWWLCVFLILVRALCYQDQISLYIR